MRIVEQIVSRIREQIEKGEFQPGDRLPSERTLAQQFGVSRTSLREAMQVLGHTGFVKILPGSGVYIRSIDKRRHANPPHALFNGSEKHYREAHEFRTAVEAWAVGLAAQRADADDLSRLKKNIDRMQICLAEKNLIDKLDDEFHLAIAQASHNTICFHVFKTILHMIARTTHIIQENLSLAEEDPFVFLADHKMIFQAIGDKDVLTARELIQSHLSRVTPEIGRKT